MNNTVKYTSEYVYNNNKLDKTREIVEKILNEDKQKNCENYRRIVKDIYVAEILDKIKKRNKHYFC